MGQYPHEMTGVMIMDCSDDAGLARVFEALWTQITGTPGAQVNAHYWRVGRVYGTVSPHSHLGDLRRIVVMPKNTTAFFEFDAIHRASEGYKGDLGQLVPLAREFGLTINDLRHGP